LGPDAPALGVQATPAAAATEGRVYDLGYTPYEGPRLGRRAAFRAMFYDGGRRALGLRRKAWAKVLPWALIAAAIVPAAWFVALTFVVAGFSLEDAGPFGDPAEFFVVIGTLAMFFVGLTGPALLMPDRRHGVLAIYASRPVRASDYLLARAATLVVLTSLYMLIPHAILYLGISALYVDGFRAGLAEHASEIPAILGTTAAYVLAYGTPAFLVGLFAERLAIASGVYVVIMFLTSVTLEAIPRATDLVVFQVIAPFMLFWNPLSVRDWLFDREPQLWPLERVGLEPWVAAATILFLAFATALVAHRRYRRFF
jgi:ABC-2 type transport system permease protein